MNFALNEVEATAKKAARGAGYPWGLAEEAGKATRWLCARGEDGCGALARLLVTARGVTGPVAPPAADGVWASDQGPMCPLTAGAALSDRVQALPPEGISLGAVRVPAFLFPFAALIAQSTGAAIALSGPGVSGVTDGRGLSLSAALPDEVAHVTLSLAGDGSVPPAPTLTRATPRDRDWAVLLDYAARTYAPATEASRLKGAGAGLTDND